MTISKCLDRRFRISENNSSFLNEILGGIITFFAMIYILPVNSGILSVMGMDVQGVFAATALVSGGVTILMGLYANYPIGLSSGMGLNAFLSYNICKGLGFSWQESMILLFANGIIFFVMSVTPLRVRIIDAFPDKIKKMTAAALGAFICFVGFKGAGVVTSSPATLVTLGNPLDLQVLLAFIGIFVVLFMNNSEACGGWLNKFAIPFAIFFVAALGCLGYYIGFVNLKIPAFENFPHFGGNFGCSGLKDVVFFGQIGSDRGDTEFLKMVVRVFSNPASYAAIFSVAFVNLFDTSATIFAVQNIAFKSSPLNMKRVVVADAAGALVCAPLGTSTVTSFAECTTGISFGAKTGFASLVTGLCFLLTMFIYPVFSVFTHFSVTCPALVCVGGMIFIGNVREIDWTDKLNSFTAFMTIFFAVLTYSLTNGICIGLASYIVSMLACRRIKEVDKILILFTVFFIVALVINFML